MRFANRTLDRWLNEPRPRERRIAYRVGSFVGRYSGLHALLRWLAKYDQR